MPKQHKTLKPGQLVVTNQTITAYQLPSLDEVNPKADDREKWTALPKGVPLMVMKHYVFSGSVHSHYHPEQPLFSEVLVFLYDHHFFYITGNRPPNQNGSSLIGNRVTLPKWPQTSTT